MDYPGWIVWHSQVSIHGRSLAKSYQYPPLASPKNSENIGNKKLALVSPIFNDIVTGYLNKYSFITNKIIVFMGRKNSQKLCTNYQEPLQKHLPLNILQTSVAMHCRSQREALNVATFRANSGTKKLCNLLILISLFVEFIICFMTKKINIYFFRRYQNNSINSYFNRSTNDFNLIEIKTTY